MPPPGQLVIDQPPSHSHHHITRQRYVSTPSTLLIRRLEARRINTAPGALFPLLDHAVMADITTTALTPSGLAPTTPSVMTDAELVEHVKKDISNDEARTAAGASDLPTSAPQTGMTLDLSHRNITTLPTEVVLLIKDKVERYANG